MKDTDTKPVQNTAANENFAIPSMKDLLEAGVQFGHPVQKWNPKMEKFIYTKRAGFHIFNLLKTQEYLEKALEFLYEASKRGDIVFIGTKRQASDIVKQEAVRAGAHYVVNRWVGGLFTNFDLLRKSFDSLNDIEKQFTEGVSNRTKQEVMWLKKKWSRLHRLYEGIRLMKSKPAAVVIIDSHYDRAAVKESMMMGIPVVAIIDTNSDPDKVSYPIPGNDDAIGAIKLFMKLFADTVLKGNGGRGVRHTFIDFTKYDVEIKKDKSELVVGEETEVKEAKVEQKPEIKIESAEKKEVIKKGVKKTTNSKSVKKPAKAKTTKTAVSKPKKKTKKK